MARDRRIGCVGQSNLLQSDAAAGLRHLRTRDRREEAVQQNALEILATRGYQEAITYSFIDPKLFELCEHFGITEYDVKDKTEELFGEDKAGFHDARFDTTAMFLAMNEGMKRNEVISELEDYL